MPKNQVIKEDASDIKNEDFATHLAELEKLVTDLESDIAIEQALALFERGVHLSNKCEKFLVAAEQKVEILKRTANGVTVETFRESTTFSTKSVIDNDLS